MAESWNEWLNGSPERRLQYADAQRKSADDIRDKPMYRAMGRMADRRLSYDGEVIDPRESRMAMMQDTLMSPTAENEAADAVQAAADYALDYGGRMRDTAFSSMAESSKGNYGNAAALAARVPLAGLYPPAGAGMRGQPDDWRATAEKNGVPTGHILATDILTDPENWITAPVKGPLAFVAPGVLMRSGAALSKLSKADDVLRALGRAGDTMRYGPGPATFLVDEAGDTIRRLRSAY